MPVARIGAGNRKVTKHTGVNCVAATNAPDACLTALPGNPDRVMLLIQNTGDNPGVVRFGEPILGDGTDMLFDAGAGLLWDREETCPETSISFGSELGTKFAVLEQVRK